MKLERLAGLYARIAGPLTHFFLLAAVLSLPVTSLPLLSELMGGTVVAPPTVVFVALGLAISLPLALIKRHAWPGEIIALVVFVLVAVVSSLASFFAGLPVYKAVSLYREVLQAILSLLLGVACFVFFATAIRRPEQYKSIFGALNIGGMLIILWCLLQLFYTYVHGREYAPAWLLSIHNALSTTRMMEFVYQRRVTGFALEPSWLAHQMNCIYLPYWLGASLTGFSSFRFRMGKISVENVLLVCGIGISFASLSRIGYLSLLLVLAYLLWRGNGVIAGRIAGRASGSEKRRRGIRLGVQLGILAGFIVLALAGAYLLTRLDYRFALLFQQNFLTTDFFFLANNLSLAERFAYWGLGWNVFARSPWLGVGLGNVGFYFESLLPGFGWAVNEFQKIQLELSILLNAKNLWIRLLAETGVLGASIFITWLYTVYVSARSLHRRSEPLYRALAWMGTLAVIALIGEGFSVDSFALPYYWTAFGLAVAASFLTRNSQAAEEAPAPGKD
jgi:O-antigen ligase